MTALRKIGAVWLLAIGTAGIVGSGASALEAQSEAEPQAAHTALPQTESVLGKSLTASGRNVGRIVDVLADESGRVRAVVVDYGGFLGLGSRRIAVAWSDLSFDSDKPSSVSTSLPEERLSAAPEVKTGKPVVVVTARNQPRNRAQNGVTQY